MSLEEFFLKLPARFRQRINIEDRGWHTHCWIWIGSHSGNGKGGDYGRASWLGCTVAVHRLLYCLFHRVMLTASRQLDHLCEVRRCCNPEHLEPTTNRENTRRRYRRERRRKRSGNHTERS